MPKDPKKCAEKLALIQRGGILPEERELAEGKAKITVGERRQAELGKPEYYDSSKIVASDFGYDNDFMHEVMINLGGLRTQEPISRDKNLVQAIRELDDMIEVANLLNERLHEWYGMYFPELADLADGKKYSDLVAHCDSRKDILKKLGVELESIGAEMEPADLDAMRSLAQNLCDIYAQIDRTDEYITKIVEEISPNMCALIGSLLSARLINYASGLERLASMPSSTVQLLGAEKAMFRHLRSGKKPPKHGIIYQFPDLRNAPYWQRGNIARALAGKILIAAKVDAFKGEFCGDKLSKELQERIADIKKRYPDPPKKSKPQGKSKGKKHKKSSR